MGTNPPVIVHPIEPSGGRPVTIRGEPVGTAHDLFDVLEFLRRANLPETDTAVDDPELIEWRGGGPQSWAESPP
ncbi:MULTISPECIES: hypothetical protein [Streptomyces]|jgi:hypothetical protein|uniref:Uncharacterized protein n=2 Tax=Streptomyces TaxID=1883 RepID=A0A1G9YZK1_9ACTN|nr:MULTISPECIES: hypothetical protein [Streptomyces]MCZ7456344.1 hypothetical protein [Streptomyces sp. WMMC940]MDI9887159.1 hypothetical protein [Streptomyces sp. HNM0645]TLQ42130.1 hypothetical protein FEF34_01710 [Streptomyces marianii]SDN14357.1 hypothetical protein SAMN05444921_12041 [Streptomyces wuyuanensis]